MMATLENSIAERNCQTLGRCRGESYSHTVNSDPRGTLCEAQKPRAIWGGLNKVCSGIQSKAQ